MLKRRNAVSILGILLVLSVSFNAGAQIVDRIVALVNNDIITLRQLNKATQPYREKIAASQQSEEKKAQLLAQLDKDMLSQLVEQSLTKQAAQKHGIQVDQAEVDQAIENVKKKNNLDDASLEAGLAAEGLTMAGYRAKLKDQITQSMLINRAVRSKVIITDQDIKAYYKANEKRFLGLKKYRLRNILTRTRDQMNEVVARLDKGEDFSAVAKAFSMGSNASQGGDLGLFDIDSFSKEIKDAVTGLEKGQRTQVLQTGSAYQIIYVEDIVMEGSQTLDEAKDKIREILFRQQGEKQFKEWMKTLKKNAHIKVML
jgi:peptidyl-prolyl cis-trans isomerase SurA